MHVIGKVILKTIENRKYLNTVITYGFSITEFGEIIIGFLAEECNAICHLHFVADRTKKSCIDRLQHSWPNASLVEDNQLAQQVTDQVLDVALNSSNVDEEMKENQDKESTIEVLVCGTVFQVKVWKALLQLRPGWVRTYSEIALMAGNPKAVRAAASAVANNEICILIPCHRVISKNGNKFKYSGGSDKKRQLLEYEAKITGCKNNLE